MRWLWRVHGRCKAEISCRTPDQDPVRGASRMNDSGDLAAWIELSLVSGLGDQRFRALLSTFGLPTDVLKATRSQLSRVVPEALAAGILERKSGSEVEKALRWAARPEHKVLTLADTEYPKQLLEIADPPALLYVAGNAKLLSSPALAVGGRDGGVDSAAPRGGRGGGGSRSGVRGRGIDSVHRRRKEPLAEEILLRGALVSESPLGTPPTAGNFPRRNRLISGLARGCLVVEATLDSGSLITARLAAEQGREVLAIPGSIHSPLSRGCHSLIKQGAKLVESAQDVLEELGVAGGSETRSQGTSAGPDLLDQIGFGPCHIYGLIARRGLTAEIVSASPPQLELVG